MKILTPGDKAPDSVVVNTDNKPVNLADLWSDGPTLLVFLRHFGCIFCRERLNQLAHSQAEIEAAGLRIVAVGIGEAQHAEQYCAPIVPQALCLASEDAAIYQSYGFSHVKLGDILSFTAVKNTVRAFTTSTVFREVTGDFRMIGGTLLVDKDGVVQYAYYSKTPGDHPPFSVVLTKAREIFGE